MLVLFHHNKQAGNPKVTSLFLCLSIREENFGTESLIRSLGRKCSGNSKEKDLASLKIDEICIKGKSWEINVKIEVIDYTVGGNKYSYTWKFLF